MTENRALAEDALAVLVGTPWHGIGRCLDMGVLDFGGTVEIDSAVHGTVARAQYSLHLQCPFRITGRRGLLTGSDDLRPRRGGDGADTLYDHLAAELDRRLAAHPLVVRRIGIGEAADLRIDLDEGVVVQAFVVGCRGESWRLVVRPDGAHLVFEDGRFESVPAIGEGAQASAPADVSQAPRGRRRPRPSG